MLAHLFRYDVIKRLSHGYYLIGPMGNAMRAVPSHGTFPMGIPFPWTSLTIRLQWVPGHSFLPGNDAADELVRRGVLLVPFAISCSLSPLISRIHSRLFSDWRRTVSSKFFDTQVPRFPPRGLCSLVMLAVSSLVYAATDTAFS